MSEETNTPVTSGGDASKKNETAAAATVVEEKKDDAAAEKKEEKASEVAVNGAAEEAGDSKKSGETDAEKRAENDTATQEKSDGPWQPQEESANEAVKSNKNERIYTRKMARIPKEVFDYMVQIEDDGVVRINVTQLSVFVLNDLTKWSKRVDAKVWRTTDEVAVMDISVPPTAKIDPMMVVDNFSNEPEAREAQEERLQVILERRNRPPKTDAAKKLPQVAKQPQQNKQPAANESASVAKIAPAQGEQAEAGTGKGRKRKRKGAAAMQQNGKTDSNGQQTAPASSDVGKKRAADSSASGAPQGGSAPKQARVEVKNSAPSQAGKSFPKKGGPTPGNAQQKPAARGQQRGGAGSGAGGQQRGGAGPVKKSLPNKRPRMPYQRPMPAFSPMMPNPREWQSGPTHLAQRYTTMNEPRDYGDRYFGDRRSGGADVSPWSRPSNRSNDIEQLETVMRRAARENRPSFETAKQVERLGLSSAMGAMLNAVDRRGTSRSMDRDDSYGRSRRRSGEFESSSSGVRDRDISRYVEPLDDYDSPNRRSSRVERVTYPSSGGSLAPGGGSGAPPFGQSYNAFFNQSSSYGGGMDYGSRSPIGSRRW